MITAAPRLNRLPADQRDVTIADFLVPIRIGERMGARLRNLGLVVLGAVVIYLSTLVSFPVPGTPIPATGQTFGVLLVGGALGLRRGIASIGLYVAVGLIGLPFFAGGEGGTSVILSAKGGYILGFVVAGAVVGRLAELGWDRRLAGALGAMAIGNVVIYLVGVPWLMAVAHLDVATGIKLGLTPFVVGDAMKLILAAGAFPVAWWVVGRRPGDE
ncbi:MAG TPA: biotin transporter BioY [Candidatus Limnocylindrales bacterium]|nr:biotin transporter BioY [Candidatus Limnocylindrales bacterium]